MSENDKNDLTLPRGYEDLFDDKPEEKSNLKPEDRELLEKFSEGLKAYMEHRKACTIQDWYFYRLGDDIHYGHTTGYYASHEPTHNTIEFGSEFDGFQNQLRFLKAVTGYVEEFKLNQSCYNCMYYIPDWSEYHEDSWIRNHCWILDPNSYQNYDMRRYYRDKEQTIKHHCSEKKPCEYYTERETPLESPIDYTQYDMVANEWHKLNSVNGWSFWVAKNVPEYHDRDIALAKHLESQQIIFLGVGKNGLENSLKLFHSVTGKKDVSRIGSCFSCKNYPDLKEDICKANHIMKGPKECKDYTDKYPRE